MCELSATCSHRLYVEGVVGLLEGLCEAAAPPTACTQVAASCIVGQCDSQGDVEYAY